MKVGNVDILQSALSDESQEQPAEVQQEQQPVAEATGEQTAATPAETQEQQQDEPTKGLQAALIAERRKRQELEAWIRSQQAAPRQEPPQAQGNDAPDPANYHGNEQQYWRDLARYEARQELLQFQEQARKQHEMAALNERVAKQQARMAEVVTAGQSKYRDFDAVINSGLAPFLSETLRDELGASDQGEDVAYYLGKNPQEAARLSQLDPRSLAREIVRLEQKVSKPVNPVIPQTLTQVRDSRGRFEAPYDGPTPLDAILGRK